MEDRRRLTSELVVLLVLAAAALVGRHLAQIDTPPLAPGFAAPRLSRSVGLGTRSPSPP